MPLPAFVVPAIGAVGNIVSSIFGSSGQAKANQEQRDWNEKMYKMQRIHALRDSHHQNQYNHPSSQMARLREAGLNPNLIYGDGNASPTAAQIRQSSPGAYNPKPAQFDPGGAMGAFVNTALGQAQVDNLRTANTLTAEQINLARAQAVKTAADTAKTISDTDTNQFNLQLARKLEKTSIEVQDANLQKIRADIDATVHGNLRAEVMQKQNIAESMERIMNMQIQRPEIKARIKNIQAATAEIQQRIEIMKKDGTIKDIEIGLREDGVSPNDPLWMRVIHTALRKMFGNFF